VPYRPHCVICGKELNHAEVQQGKACWDQTCRRDLRTRNFLTRTACIVCGKAISAHSRRADETCGGGLCVTERKSEAVRLKQEADITARHELARLNGVRIAEERGLPPEAVIGLALPFQNRPLVPPPPEKVEIMRTRITSMVAEALQTPEAVEHAKSHADVNPPWLAAGCATCRGACCLAGGATWAFLEVATFQRILHEEPELVPEELVADYMAAIPAEHTQNSCLFQGERGCTLPRHRRANICNAFFCPPLQHGLTLVKKSVAEIVVTSNFVAGESLPATLHQVTEAGFEMIEDHRSLGGLGSGNDSPRPEDHV
jgi:hypothetical protein